MFVSENPISEKQLRAALMISFRLDSVPACLPFFRLMIE